MKFLLPAIAISALLFPPVSSAQEATFGFGGDQYAAGQAIAILAPVERDAFVAGSDVTLGAAVTGDAHLGGFSVNVNAAVTGDVYAVGFSVNTTAPIGGDVTAAGNNVVLRAPATVAGNARLAGANVTIAAPIAGSALVSAQTLTLDAPIAGDLSFFGDTIAFAPAAKVDGILSIQAPNEIAVPESVAAADRVRFELLVAPDYVSEAGRTAETVVRRIWPAVWIAASGWLALFLVGAALIALMPRAVARMKIVSETRPFRNLGFGVLAFATVLGLVPVTVLTLVGILLLPVVFVFIAIGCAMGYLAGALFFGLRVSNAFVQIDTNLKRVAVLAVALIVAALVGMVPVIGWLFTLVLLVFGLGVIAVSMLTRWSTGQSGGLHPSTAAAVAATPGP